MLKYLLFVFLAGVLIACNGPSKKKSVLSQVLNKDSLAKLEQDSIDKRMMVYSDSIRRITDSLCDLPPVNDYKQTIFRYRYTVFYGNITFVCTIMEQEDSSFCLVSKCIINGENAFFRKDLRTVKNVIKTPEGPAVVYTSTQPISEKDWTTFRKIINGSYYWTFDDPMPDDGILDGEVLSLDSKSRWPRHWIGKYHIDSLRYHYNSIHCPFKGNYTDAYHFLYQKSMLLQRFGPMADVNSYFR